MSHDLLIPQDKLNRYGRRSAVAMQRKSAHANRVFNHSKHLKSKSEKIQEGIAYRIAKRIGDMPAIRLFQLKHPKLRKQFVAENRQLKRSN